MFDSGVESHLKYSCFFFHYAVFTAGNSSHLLVPEIEYMRLKSQRILVFGVSCMHCLVLDP